MEHLKELGWPAIISLLSMLVTFVVVFTRLRSKVGSLERAIGHLEALVKELDKKLTHIETHGCIRVTGDLTSVHREIEEHDRRLQLVESSIVKIASMATDLQWIKETMVELKNKK